MFRYYIDLGHTLASALPLFPREKSGSRARDQGVYVTLLDFARIFSVPRFSRIVESEGLLAAACEPDCAVMF